MSTRIVREVPQSDEAWYAGVNPYKPWDAALHPRFDEVQGMELTLAWSSR